MNHTHRGLDSSPLTSLDPPVPRLTKTLPCFPLSETTHALQSRNGVPERIGRTD
jgi:hypothetical protein